MANILTRVLRGIVPKWSSPDAGNPTQVNWGSPVQPVLDVGRVAAAHSPNADDGWFIIGRTCVGNATAVADLEFDLDLAGGLQVGAPFGGGSVAIGGDQPVWIAGVSVMALDVAPGSGARIALYQNFRAGATVASAQFMGIWTVNTNYDDVPWDPATPSGTPYALGVSGQGTFAMPLPWRFAPGDKLRIVSVGIDSTMAEQVQVTLRMWASPDGGPPPGFGP